MDNVFFHFGVREFGPFKLDVLPEPGDIIHIRVDEKSDVELEVFRRVWVLGTDNGPCIIVECVKP